MAGPQQKSPPASLNFYGRKVAGAVDADEVDLTSWSVQAYELGIGRAADQVVQKVALAEDSVVEFTLQGGQRVLVAAEDVPEYFPGLARGGDSAVQVGLVMSPPGVELATSRDGLSAWFVKSLKVYKDAGVAGMAAVTAAGTLQDRQLGQRNGLYRVSMDKWGLEPAQRIDAKEGVLVLLHGTISSAEGSFGDLWGSNRLALLERAYPGGVYALEHRTLTESPVDNALALAKTLPKGARISLLSHSRGGLVGELIARANRKDEMPFTPQELAQLVDDASALGLKGYDAIALKLRELGDLLRANDVVVERFVRVACPARGTTILADRLDRWASVMTNLVNLGVEGVSSAAFGVSWPSAVSKAAFNFFGQVVRMRADARILPGLEAMRPDSPLIALLNRDDAVLAGKLFVVSGDHVGDGVLKQLGDGLAERYFGGRTDLVVNTPSMTGGARREDGIFEQEFREPSGYYHLNYFRQEKSSLAIVNALCGVPEGFKRVGPSREEIARGKDEPREVVEVTRGGEGILNVLDNPPIVFILPGIMGSSIKRGDKRIWMELLRIMDGRIGELGIDAPDVRAAGWIDLFYEALARDLKDSHEVRPFSYDWRISIEKEAERFGAALDGALDEGDRRGKPVRILAHSMGGLVARLALTDARWARLRNQPGARFVQLGTPNGGSASIAQVLLGRDAFVRNITKLDRRHSARQFLDIVARYPGVLELLPLTGVPGVPESDIDYFNLETWKAWGRADEEDENNLKWALPTQEALTAAKRVVEQIQRAPLDGKLTLYVAGCAPETPVAVRVADGRIQIGTTREGDGRVPWKSGIPHGVKTWYVETVHGDLPANADAFNAYRQLLEMGQTPFLSQQPIGGRGGSEIRFRATPPLAALHPTRDELAATALGGTVLAAREREEKLPDPVEMRVVQGNLTTASHPVMIGAYAYDRLTGTAQLVDERLNGRLKRAKEDGVMPNNPGEAKVFLQFDPKQRPRGAIVVGLGPVGVSSPGDLSRAYEAGLLEYVNTLENESACAGSADKEVHVATLLIGTGFGGLALEVSIRSLLDAMLRVGVCLRREGRSVEFKSLEIFERAENRAISAAQALRRCLQDRRYARLATFSGHVTPGDGGYRVLTLADGGLSGSRRIHIEVDDHSRTLNFTLVTDRARNVLTSEPTQRKTIDSMLREVTGSVSDREGLTRTMFELLVPNPFKTSVGDTGGVVLGLDYASAEYPWELLRDTANKNAPPLCTRIGVVRQLTTSRGSNVVAQSTGGRMLVIGDTESGLAPLPGAVREAETIRDIAQDAGLQPMVLLQPHQSLVWEALFDGDYTALHLACHGVADVGQNEVTPPEGPRPMFENMGAVLAKDVLLTSAHIAKLRKVPQFVFLNCCHLGNMAGEIATLKERNEASQWSRLAANLGTQFIEMGASAVVVAGWEVHDGAAEIFAQEFYKAMFAGVVFAEALRRARFAAYDHFPGANTWGAYQAYGDEKYRFPESLRGMDGAAAREPEPYVHEAEVLSELELIRADADAENDKERKAKLKMRLDGVADRALSQYGKSGAVLAKLVAAYAELKLWDPAIQYGHKALLAEDGKVCLKMAEQLANAEARRGAELLSDPADKQAEESREKRAADIRQGEALLKSSEKRLAQLIDLGGTVERRALLAATFKRRVGWLFGAEAKKTLGAKAAQDGKRALLGMTLQYLEARNASKAKSDSADYYATFNMLCGVWLLKMNRTALPDKLKEFAQGPGALAQEMVEDSKRRLAAEHSFFHAAAPCDVAMLEWLWKMTAGSRVDAGKVDGLAADYAAVMKQFGGEKEIDSVKSQMKFLHALLPAKAAQVKALEQLQAAISAKFEAK